MSITIFNRTFTRASTLREKIQTHLDENYRIGDDLRPIYEIVGCYNSSIFGICSYRSAKTWRGARFDNNDFFKFPAKEKQ
jgi:hypothetical protein